LDNGGVSRPEFVARHVPAGAASAAAPKQETCCGVCDALGWWVTLLDESLDR
jgi:hypothetical protein